MEVERRDATHFFDRGASFGAGRPKRNGVEFESRTLEDGVGDFSFVRVIGSGAFGSVFLGRHPRFGDVAIKALKKASIKNVFDLAKVERELSILMGVLDHPNVLEILSCLHGAMLFCS